MVTRLKIFVLAAVLLTNASLSAQENEKISYSNITEFGLITASPKGIGVEATTAHGIAFDKTHILGFGVGIGIRTASTLILTPFRNGKKNGITRLELP